jgi:membrane protein
VRASEDDHHLILHGPWWFRVRRFLVSAWQDHVLFLASALSFDALLVAVPLILLYISVFGYVLNVSPEDIGAVRSALQLVLPDHGAGVGDPLAQAERLIDRVVASRQEFSLFGIPLFILFSTRLFASVRIALDRVLGVETKRRWRHDLLHDLGLVVIVTGLFSANTLLTLPFFGELLNNSIVSHGVAMMFSTVLFFVVYSLSPTQKPRWDLSLVAAVAAAVTFEVSKILFGVYLRTFVTVDRLISNANAIALLLFALWIYVTTLIFLLGGEVAKSRHERKLARASARQATVE